MNFTDIINKSEIILIEGGKKQGKLTFALYESANEKTLIFSAYQKPIFFKRLSAITNLKDENIQSALSKVKFLTLKEDWLEYKIKYGYDFLLEDIKRAIKEYEPKNVIFHRLDLVFGTHISDNTSIFMEKLIGIKEMFECKFFITVTPTEENETIIETIEDFSDLNIEIRKEKERIIVIKNSIFPVQPDKYYFLYKNDRIEIKPVDTSIKTSKSIHILLITDKKELIELHKYIFSKKGFFIDVATSMSDTINKILSSPDIIIYNPKDEKLDLSVCNTIKQQKIPSKLIYITQSDYVRAEDKMKALESGCYEMFPLNFMLGEYILEIEKMLNNNFYTSILNKLSKNKIITNLKNFCEIINSLYNESVFFTILKFNLNAKPDKIREKLRNTDIIYFNETNQTFILTLINIRKINIAPVITKLFEQNKPDIKIFEATEWKEKEEEICK
ncbi:response regulator [Nautilia lithotrophica]